MDRRTFGLLYKLLHSDDSLKMDSVFFVGEQVCVFLHVLAHHVKNQIINNCFNHSEETISRFFNFVFKEVLQLQYALLNLLTYLRK